MKKLNLIDLDDLAIGSAILGSGGGGDPHYPFMMTRYEMEKKGFVSLIDLSEISPKDLFVAVGMIGAPLAETEKILSGREFLKLFSFVEKAAGRKAKAIIPFEIGGGNAFTPLMVAAQLDLPVIDADTMGRAFPEGHMSSCHLFEIDTAPVFITDALGNTVAIHATNAIKWEKIGRLITVAMGSCAGFGLAIPGNQLKKCLLPKTMSKAIKIGKIHREAKMEGQDPLKAILKQFKGDLIGSGSIVDIDRVISKGFLSGKVTIQNAHETIELAFQNEYLLAKCNGKVQAMTPDILMILEQETGTPVTSESLIYGLKVNLISLPAPDIWTTSAGLAIVGPRAFGYELDYQSVEKLKTAK